jgi:hypothetical protein
MKIRSVEKKMLKYLMVVAFAGLLGGCAFELEPGIDSDKALMDSLGNIEWMEWDSDNNISASVQLAVDVVKNAGKEQYSGNGKLKAYAVEYYPPAVMVAVEQPDQNMETMKQLTYYRFEDKEIFYVSKPVLVDVSREDSQKSEREEAAKEVAIQAKNGTLSSRPNIYLKKYLYTAKYEGSCTIIVNEKNIERVPTGSYIIDVCR